MQRGLDLDFRLLKKLGIHTEIFCLRCFVNFGRNYLHRHLLHSVKFASPCVTIDDKMSKLSAFIILLFCLVHVSAIFSFESLVSGVVGWFESKCCLRQFS